MLTLPAAGQGCCLAYRSNVAQHAIVQSAGTANNYTHKATAPKTLYNALRSLTQPCMTAYCIQQNTYDPGISLGSANQCILGDVYLRSNLSRKSLYM